MRMLSYYEGDSYLHRVNPAFKLIANVVLITCVALFFDPVTPAVFLVLALTLTSLLSGLSASRLLRILAPFFPFAAGLILYNTLFFRAGPEAHTLFALGPMRATQEGLRLGLSVGLRVLSIVTFSLMFVTTTNPTHLVMSLLQQLHLPPRIGYATLAALRTLPLLDSELATIRAAHRVRGAGEGGGVFAWFARLRRYAVPLLASTIRRAHRVALAMDARGFGCGGERTYYVRTRVRRGDWLFLLAITGGAGLALYALHLLGTLGGFLGAPQ